MAKMKLGQIPMEVTAGDAVIAEGCIDIQHRTEMRDGRPTIVIDVTGSIADALEEVAAKIRASETP